MRRAKPIAALTMAVLGVHALLLWPQLNAVQSAPPNARTLAIRTIALQSPINSSTPVRVAAEASGHTASPITPPAAKDRAAPSLRVVDALAAATVPSSPAAPVAVPGPVRLHYKVQMQRGSLIVDGRGELRWRHDGEAYDARLELSAPLLRSRSQHSAGRITAEGLAPLRFADKGRSEEATHFDHEQGKLSFSSNRPDLPLVRGTQDRLSVLMQVAALVAGDPLKFPPGGSITIHTAGTRDAEPWVFVVEATEQLQLPGGVVTGLKLTRSPRKEYDVKVELWLAPGMDYVPVRLRLTQPNGDSVDQQWASTDRG